MSRPRYSVLAGERRLEVGERPLLMGVVNASPDSFSDERSPHTLAGRLALARAQVRAGADIVDVGGESARTGRRAISPEHEIELVAPLVEAIAGELETVISVDTYKPAVAAAAIGAGAGIVNDVSGLRDPELAAVCARTGAALVVMDTRAAPKERRQDPDLYREDVAGDVIEFLARRIETALAAGVSFERLIVDPGPDFSKTPAQTIALLRECRRLHELGRPLLMAISRKDFIGALTGRAPRGRQAGTLAALAHGLQAEAHIFRVHDVAAAAEFIAVWEALQGERAVSRDLALAEELRSEPPSAA
ncbi:MAG TPA: dihydropteroate synthase [Solirubrobacteraceae bacterium]|nr:dihydropteroate synthase [Solirubrobacteraceae bacterium]